MNERDTATVEAHRNAKVDVTWLFETEDLNDPQTVRSDIIATSVRIEEGPGHDRVTLWNRGGNSGTLTVKKGDGIEVGTRLFGDNPYQLTQINHRPIGGQK